MKEILFSSHESQPANTFGVYEVIKPHKNKQYDDKDIKSVFKGDGDLGSLLFGWGIALWLTNVKNKTAFMLFHPNDETMLPNNAQEIDE